MAEALACTCGNGGFGACSCPTSGRGDSYPADEWDQADSLASSGSDWGGGLACTCANGGFGGCSCAASGRGDNHPADVEDEADSPTASIHPASGGSLAAESSAQGQLIPRGCSYRDVRLSELRTAVQPRRDVLVQREPSGIQAIRERRLCPGDIRMRRPMASSLPALALSEAGDWFQTTHYVLLHWAEAVFLGYVLRQWHEEAQKSNSGQGSLLRPF